MRILQYAILLCVCLLGFSPARAQERLDIHLRQVRLDSIQRVVAKYSPYTLYYSKGDTDSLRFTLHVSSVEQLMPALADAVKAQGLLLQPIGPNLWVVMKGRALQISLPASYFQLNPLVVEVSENTALEARTMATVEVALENKVYAIGNPALANRPGRAVLTGYVREQGSGQPIPGVAVYIESPNIHTTTDAYGFYSIALPRGEQKVLYKSYGMSDASRQLQLHSDGNIDVTMQEQVFSLTGITVTAEKMGNIRNVQMGLERVSIDRIKHVPSAFGEADVMKVVLTLPGVKSVGEASSGFNVRGGATDQNLILFNDGTVYNPTHLFGLFSSFNPDIVSNIELYKSGIPAQFGGRISSVLEVNSREGNKDKFTGSAGLGLLTSKLHVEGPITYNKSSYIFGARTTYSDWLLGLLPDNSGYKNGTAGFYDLNGSTSFQLSEKDQVFVHGYYSRDRFSFNVDTAYRYQNINASLKWRHLINRQLNFVVTAGYDSYGYTNKDTHNESSAYALSFRVQQLYGRLNFNWFAGDRHTVRFGLHSVYYNLNPGNYLPEGAASLVVPLKMPQEQATENALYIGDTWNITNKLSLDMGLRASLYSALGPSQYFTYAEGQPKLEATMADSISVGSGKFVKPYWGPEYRIAARYIIRPDFSVKLGFNSMRQHIHMLSNSVTASPTDIWKLSDYNIVPQTGWQAAAGLYKNFANNTIEVSLEGYFKRMNHYLDYKSAAELILNPHIETDVVETRGKAYGVELLIKKNLGKLNGWFSYTYSRTFLQQSDMNTPNPINRGDWYPASYDKPHDVKLVGNYKFTHRVSISLNVDYATGRPVTIPISRYQYGGGNRVFYSDRNAYRIPDYFRMDFALNIEPSHKLTLLTHSTIVIGVYNLTGRRNAYSVYYNAQDGKRVQGYMLTIFGAPIPYVSYNIKF
jgi:Outer membrane receptor proteins, mostly Fe transport